MRRKLIKQGNNALTLTIPRKWTEKHQLSAGDEVEICELQTSLEILPISTTSKKSIEIKLENTQKDLIRSVIASAYKSGYDIIILHCAVNPAVIKKIYDITNTFTGLEIIEQTQKSITIQCYLQESVEQTEKLINKMFQTVHYGSSLIEASQEEIELLHNQTIHKLRDHTLRAIHKTSYGNDKTYDYYDLVTILEKISAANIHLATHVKESKKKDEETTKLNNYFSKLYSAYQLKSYNKSHLVWAELKKIRVEILEEKKSKQKVHIHYYHILELFRHLSSRILSLSS